MYPESAGTGIHPQINRLCREAGFKPTIAMEAGEASTIIGLVAAGCGVSVLPSSFDIIRMSEVCYRPLADASATTRCIWRKRKDAVSPLVAAFVAVAMAQPGLRSSPRPVRNRRSFPVPRTAFSSPCGP
jgi:DNA-binding transcriptional LysR family regulator